MVRIRPGLHGGEKIMEPDSPPFHALHPSVQPSQRRRERCQSTSLCNLLEEAEVIPAAVCSGGEDLPGIKGRTRQKKYLPGEGIKEKSKWWWKRVTTDATSARVSRDVCIWEQSLCPAEASPIL